MHDSLRRDAFLVGALVFGLALGVAAIWSVTRPAPPAPAPEARPRPRAAAILPYGPRIHGESGAPSSESTPDTAAAERTGPADATPAPAGGGPKPWTDRDAPRVHVDDAGVASRRGREAHAGGAVVVAASGSPAPASAKPATRTPEIVGGAGVRLASAPDAKTTATPADPADGAGLRGAGLEGAGATFPAVLYGRWIADYGKDHPDIRIDYQAIGSGGGIKAITDGTVSFAGSDSPMTKAEIEKAGGEDAVVQFPSCAGGIVAIYDVPGVEKPLNLTGEILAEISLGGITKWNDPQIAAINEGVQLPDLAITPVRRTDGCRATFVWTRWLSARSRRFETQIGEGKQVKWPVGQGAKGNEGVAAVVQQTSGAIGYVESVHADAAKIPYALLKNPSGRFVACTPDSLTAAGAAAAAKMSGALLAANVCDQEGDAVYPVGSYTYLIVRRDLSSCRTKADAQALVDLLRWTVHDGQKLAAGLHYAPLAPAVVAKVDADLDSLTFRGEPLNAGR